MIRQMRLVLLISKSYEMVKETEKFDRERRVWSTCFAHFWSVPEADMGASWHWQVSINPQPVSAISHMRSPSNRRAGLLTCFVQGVSFIHTGTPELVKYSGKRVR